jgi:hypothetical protein
MAHRTTVGHRLWRDVERDARNQFPAWHEKQVKNLFKK